MSNSERRPMSGVLASWAARSAELKAWEAANPELAAKWDGALAEEEERKRKRRAELNELEIIGSIEPVMRPMGVPAITREALTLGFREGFKLTAAMSAAREFVATKDASVLVLFGGTGCGKTLAASWCLMRARSRKSYNDEEWTLDATRGAFVRAASLARIPRFEDSGQWDRLLTVPWLVLDDLGASMSGEFWTERFNELIDVRYSERRRTVITANLSAEGLRALLGERIISRLGEAGKVTRCSDPDLRPRP